MTLAEKFLQQYPITNDVLQEFVPLNWGRYQKNRERYAKEECLPLGCLDEAYGEDGLARMVVKVNIGGIYSLSVNKIPLNDENLNTVADLFVARHGMECSMWAMMVYFSGYVMDYKGTYAPFDYQDIIMQFSKKFLPWWRQKQGVKKQPEKVEVRQGPVGHEGLIYFLIEKYQRGEDLRTGGLWDNHFIGEKDIEEAMDRMKQMEGAF